MNASSLSQRYLKSNDITNIDDQNQFVFNDDRITKDPCISLFEMPKNDCVRYYKYCAVIRSIIAIYKLGAGEKVDRWSCIDPWSKTAYEFAY